MGKSLVRGESVGKTKEDNTKGKDIYLFTKILLFINEFGSHVSFGTDTFIKPVAIFRINF